MGELSGEGCLVPILPGFDETSVLDTRDGSACDLQALISLLVLKRCGPMEADQVAFGKQGDFLDFKIQRIQNGSRRRNGRTLRAHDSL